MPTCQSCGARVVFAKSAKSGKSMILDAKLEKRVVSDEALVHWGHDPHDVPLYAKGEHVARVADVYTDQHVTCPEAASWEGKTGATAARTSPRLDGEPTYDAPAQTI